MSNVVIRLSDRVVKGTTDLKDWTADFLDSESHKSPCIHIQDAEAETIPLDNIKAVFFVKELAGTSHDELRYYDNLSPLPCLWIRATFKDGESIEGIVRNELSFFSQSRFLMAPVDPDSNNELILVFKDRLVDFRILGLRKAFEELPEYIKCSELDVRDL